MGPGLFALILSLYNYYISRRGAVLKITPGHKFGFIPFQSGRKLLYFPLNVMNTGTSIGRIDSVKYEFISLKGNLINVYLRRRVETSITAGAELTQKGLISKLPILPVFCPPSEGISELLEFYDDNPEGKMLEIDKEYTCNVYMTYNGNKTAKHSFIYSISEDDWNRAGNQINWVDFKY